MRISTREHVDAARRLLRRRALWVLLGAAPVLYAGAAALLYVNQEHLIFPGAARRLHGLVPHAYYRELDCGHHDYIQRLAEHPRVSGYRRVIAPSLNVTSAS